MTTFVLSEVEEYQGTAKTGKPYRKFSFKDGNGNIIGQSFDAGLALIGSALIGKRVEAELEAASNPAWKPTVKALAEVEEVATTEQAPPDWDAKERRQFRSRAWAQAISASQHTGKSGETPKDIYTRVKPLAEAIYKDICGEFAEMVPTSGSETTRKTQPDEDIPF